MRFINTIGQRWKRAAGASLTIVMLSAVAVVGLTLLGSKVLAAWKAADTAEQALVPGGTFEGLLNFEAPAATVAQLEAKTKEAENGIKSASDAAMLVKNWQFTQTPLRDFVQTIYAEAVLIDFRVALLYAFFPNSPLTTFAIQFAQAWFALADSFLATAGFPPAPVPFPVPPPPATPFF